MIGIISASTQANKFEDLFEGPQWCVGVEVEANPPLNPTVNQVPVDYTTRIR